MLKKRGIQTIGTIRKNRIRNCPLKTDGQLKHEGRGSFDNSFDTENSIYVVKWYDRKPILLS